MSGASGVLSNILGSIPGIGLLINGDGYRPAGWGAMSPLTSVTASLPTPDTTTKVNHIIRDDQGNIIGTNSGPSVVSTQPQPTTYFFDSVIRLEHGQTLRSTEHPTQSGASIVDHAYLMPARLGLEIMMSDAVASYKSGQWTGDPSKSVSAYQTLLYLQALRIPLTVTTRLKTYSNMLIEDIRAGDDVRTLHSLAAMIMFREVLVAQVTQNTISARPHATDGSSPGTAQPTALGPTEQAQFDTDKQIAERILGPLAPPAH